MLCLVFTKCILKCFDFLNRSVFYHDVVSYFWLVCFEHPCGILRLFISQYPYWHIFLSAISWEHFKWYLKVGMFLILNILIDNILFSFLSWHFKWLLIVHPYYPTYFCPRIMQNVNRIIWLISLFHLKAHWRCSVIQLPTFGRGLASHISRWTFY